MWTILAIKRGIERTLTKALKELEVQVQQVKERMMLKKEEGIGYVKTKNKGLKIIIFLKMQTMRRKWNMMKKSSLS